MYAWGKVSGMTLVGNNVENWVTDAAQGVGGIAPIWLRWQSSNNTVVGGSNKTNVVDDGVDNVLIGVNNMGNSNLGQDIKDAMMAALEVKRGAMASDRSFR